MWKTVIFPDLRKHVTIISIQAKARFFQLRYYHSYISIFVETLKER